MTEHSQNSDDQKTSEIEENEEEEFELEGLMTRNKGADGLRRLANDVESGSIELGRAEGPVTVPEEFEAEVENEEQTDVAELEGELEWSVVDGEVSSAE